jgi:hypothetical protein
MLLMELIKTCTDVKEIKEIEQLMLLYTSKSSSVEVLTDEWADKFVMFTPKIIYGIDFNNKNPITVYAFNFNKTISPFETNQHIQRH